MIAAPEKAAALKVSSVVEELAEPVRPPEAVICARGVCVVADALIAAQAPGYMWR